LEVRQSRDILAVYDDEASVRSLSPDQAKLIAHQVSPRGGKLHCEHRGDRVIMSGQCTLFLTGSICLVTD